MSLFRTLLRVVTLLTAIAGVAATAPAADVAHAYDGPAVALLADDKSVGADNASPQAPGSSPGVVDSHRAGHDGTRTTPGLICVAPSGLVNETAGGFTNLGRGSARGPAFFDDFNPGQGFSGVYDEATGSILAFPSGPGGVVPRRGGHAVVNQRLTEAVGAPGGQRAGFTAILQSDGSLQVQWLSRSVNPSGYVPDSLRPAIIDALSQMSGRTVVA